MKNTWYIAILIIVLGLYSYKNAEAYSVVTWSTTVGGNGHSYQLVQNESDITWYTAKGYAETGAPEQGLDILGHLVTITSAEEMAFLRSNLMVGWNNQIFAWIGGQYDDDSGAWKWITGEPMLFNDWNSVPPPSGGSMRTNKNGWDAINVSSKMQRYIVETSSVPIPGAVWLLGSGLIGIIGIKRKFKK